MPIYEGVGTQHAPYGCAIRGNFFSPWEQNTTTKCISSVIKSCAGWLSPDFNLSKNIFTFGLGCPR